MQLWHLNSYETNKREADVFPKLMLHYLHCRMSNTISRKLQKKGIVPKTFKRANPTVFGFSEADCAGLRLFRAVMVTVIANS